MKFVLLIYIASGLGDQVQSVSGYESEAACENAGKILTAKFKETGLVESGRAHFYFLCAPGPA